MSDVIIAPDLPATTEAAAETPEAAPGLMDRYADGLMNELFGEVEQSLETGLALPTETLPPDIPPTGSKILMPPMVITSPGHSLDRQSAPIADMVAIREELDQVRQQGKRLDFLLLGAALASLALTVGIWWLNRQTLIVDSAVTIAPPPSPEELQAAADAEFLAYLERSLSLIDRRSELQQSNPTVAVTLPLTDPVSSLPNVIVPDTATLLPPAPTGLGVAPAPAPGSVAIAPAAPGSPFQNFALRYGTPTAPNASLPSAPTTLPIPAAGQHKLVGVIQLENDSAALFEVNGATQRVGVGQPVGNSGWSLVAVTNQEAIVRRNGDIRSIYLQQSF